MIRVASLPPALACGAALRGVSPAKLSLVRYALKSVP